MKKSLALLGLAFLSGAISAQIYNPTTTGSSGDASKTLVGQYIAPGTYSSQLLINTKISNANSTLNNLELQYAYTNNQAPGSPYTAPSLSVIKAMQWDPNLPPLGGWVNSFDLKADGNLFLGTTSGSSRLNVGGDIELPGAPGTRGVTLSAQNGELGWIANGTNPNYQNLSITYLGDGTNPNLDLMTFKPDGGINVYGFLCPDVNLSIKDNTIPSSFVPESKVHIKTYAPQESGDLGVYGLIVENTGWRTHDFGFEVRSYFGPVFSVGNNGHVLIGRQDEGEISKDMPDSDKYLLYVAKGIRTESVRVDIAADNGWADYVFEEGYELMPLAQLEQYIQQNGHLPGIPSTQEVVEDGIDLAEMNKLLLEKIEELTLRLIELEKKVESSDQAR